MTNESKQCPRCGLVKAHTEFHRNKARPDGLQSACAECQRTYVRKHYRQKPEYYRAKATRRVREQRALIREEIRAAKDAPCQDCGVRYPYYVMDFDHVRGRKRFNVGRGLSNRTLASVKREIQKCDLVCANCHRIREHNKRLIGKTIPRA